MGFKHRFPSVVAAVALLTAACSGDRDTSDSPVDSPVGDSRVYTVPTEIATIQGAIDAAESGDTILVEAGDYSGDGFRDLEFDGKALVLLAADGPENTSLMLGGRDDEYHRAFLLDNTQESGVVVDGFAIGNGYHSAGGAIWIRSASPTFRYCLFFDNTATVSGGTVRCKRASPRFVNCTFVMSRAPTGGTAFLIAGSQPSFEKCVIALGLDGGTVTCAGYSDRPRIDSTDMFANVGGNWYDCLDSLASVNGNMSLDPLFCDPEAGSFLLNEASPCVLVSDTSVLCLGAMPAGCVR